MQSLAVRPARNWLRSIGGLFRVGALVGLLAACSTIPTATLETLGARVEPAKVDFSDLYAYAARASMAYESEEEIRSAYPDTVVVVTPGNTDVLYFLEQNDKTRTQTVTIRGTANFENFWEDIEIGMIDDPRAGFSVDRGFGEVATVLYADLQPRLRKDYRIVVAGHSLGGAVAAILTAYMVNGGYTVDRCITFGQPKFTDAKGVERLEQLPITRVVDENDLVPMLPPVAFLSLGRSSYEHVGPEIILLEGQNYVFLPNHDASRLSVGELWRELEYAVLADHHMERYAARILLKRETAVQVPYAEREDFVAKTSPIKVANPAVKD